jgi:phosphoribosyl-ATP pyrophosphohydrolase
VGDYRRDRERSHHLIAESADLFHLLVLLVARRETEDVEAHWRNARRCLG